MLINISCKDRDCGEASVNGNKNAAIIRNICRGDLPLLSRRASATAYDTLCSLEYIDSVTRGGLETKNVIDKGIHVSSTSQELR